MICIFDLTLFLNLGTAFNFDGRAMQCSALESAACALQRPVYRFLSYSKNVEKLKKFDIFPQKTPLEGKQNRNSKICQRVFVEQSLLIPISKTALLYHQN